MPLPIVSKFEDLLKQHKNKVLLGLFILLTTVIILGGFLLSTEDDPYFEVIENEVVLDVDGSTRLPIESNTPSELIFESFDSNIVRVEDGMVFGMAPGESLIVIRSLDNTMAEAIVVRVNAPVTPESIQEPDESEPPLESESSNDDLDSSVTDDEPVTEPEEDPIETDEPTETEEPQEESSNESGEEQEYVSISPQAQWMVHIVDEDHLTLSSLTVTRGGLIDSNELPEESALFRGYYEVGKTCDSPFDLNTLITGSMVLVQGELNQTSPCIELDEMAFSGSFRVGETITANVSPSSANVTYAWFISEDNRDFFSMPQFTGSSILLESDYFRDYLAVNIQGIGDYEGLLKRGTERIALNTNSVQVPDEIPIASVEDLLAINSTNEHTFAAGTNQEIKTAGGPNKNYRLITNVAFTTLVSNPTDTAIINQIYTGKFDGNGYDISSVYISSSGTHLGLFRGLNNATIQNVTLSQFNITGDSIIGALSGTIEGATVLDNITVTNSALVSTRTDSIADLGGFVGRVLTEADLTINQLINAANVMGEQNHVGGLFGYVSSDTVIEIQTFVNYGLITGDDEVGGLIGQNNSALIVFDSVNQNLITGDDEVGGLIGFNHSRGIVSFWNNINRGNVISTSSDGDEIGGFVGNNENIINIHNSVNHGVVQGDEDVGGFIGNSSDILRVYNSINYGDIESVENDDEVGGLVGNNEGNTLVENFKNYGSIIGGDELGGIAGDSRQIHISNSINYGLISTSSIEGGQIGGLIGDGGDSEGDSIYIFQSANYGTVFGTDDEGIGGLIGQINDAAAEIIESFNAGNVIHAGSNTTSIEAGGIVGDIFNDDSSVTESITLTSVYNSGVISGTGQNAELGGLIASVDETQLHIENSYNVGLITGSVSGTLEIGALVGTTGSATTIVDSYYLSGSALLGTHGGNTNFRITDGAMRLASTFSGWDIFDYPNKTGVWTIGYESNTETYPRLSWEENPNIYQISNARDFEFMLLDLDGNYELMNDINLSSLGTLNESLVDADFSGTFNGNGYTLSGLEISNTGSINHGLFKKLDGAHIRNLSLSDFSINTRGYGGALAGTITGSSIENMMFSAVNITASGSDFVGGIAGRFEYSTMNAINFQGEISSTNQYMGGLAGLVKNAHISNISVTSIITSTYSLSNPSFAGGLVGYISPGQSTMTSINANVSISALAEKTGGLIGESYGVHLSHVTGSGTITVDANNAGGVIGYTRNTNTLEYIKMNITVSALNNNDQLGGFVGQATGNLNISQSVVHVNISGYRDIGGLIGLNESTAILNIENTTSSGSVTGQDNYNSGFIGFNKGTVEIRNSTNLANITGLGDLGGIIGANNGNTNMHLVSNYGDVSSNSNVGNNIGGIVGANQGNLTLTAIRNYGSINNRLDNQNIGGIIGMHYGNSDSLLLQEVMNEGSVFGKSHVGGIIGSHDLQGSKSTLIVNSYNLATIQAIGSRVGGIVGLSNLSNGDVTISNSYSAGLVTGSATKKGAIIGEISSGNSIDISDTFYLSGSAISDIGSGSSNGNAVKLTSASMQSLSTFNSAGWDIGEHPTSKTWSIKNNQSFPSLTFMGEPQIVE